VRRKSAESQGKERVEGGERREQAGGVHGASSPGLGGLERGLRRPGERFLRRNVIFFTCPGLFCRLFIQGQCVWGHKDRAGEQPLPEFAPCYLAARAYVPPLRDERIKGPCSMPPEQGPIAFWGR
jgi:hypothetical protein